MKKTTVKKSSTFFSPTSKVVHEVVKTHDPLVINKWMNSLKPNSLKMLRDLPYLNDFSDAILGRFKYAAWKIHETTQKAGSLSDLADGYLYFGLHRQKDGTWIFREWAPNATAIYIIGEMNDWQEKPEYACKPIENGVWEITLPADAMHHEELYKLSVHWNGGQGERIPSYARRVIKDEQTKICSAQVWAPARPYRFRNKLFRPQVDPLLIYECHIGMATSEEKVGTYEEFRVNVLPRIARLGYTAVQIMAIQEHPYYGSFGYHVSNFFAASSRFGTPDELKHLIDDAHNMGLAVIMDIVHSHAVKNELEGLGNFCGDPCQYFHSGGRREHPQWDSLCFDYARPEVMHFLLSNCKFWLDEYQFDGFRFDGVGSMLYLDHQGGSGNLYDYFSPNVDGDALCYVTLANALIHEFKPYAVTIGEEVSGMPGLAVPFEEGGIGFNYRLQMNVPDYWIKLLKERRDEDWNTTEIKWQLCESGNLINSPAGKTISYVESHDQALVGDKTIIFRLIDSDMYWHFKIGDENLTVHRGIALHKMIRLITLSTINGGYLNFMGNEFGHPEWIDFPREGNGWSYKYARRQWDLVDNEDLNFKFLNRWDIAENHLITSVLKFNEAPFVEIMDNRGDKVLAFERRRLLFVFNFDGERSYTDYGLLVKNGRYELVLNSDDPQFGGFGNVSADAPYETVHDPAYEEDGKGWLKLYLPARTALVLKRNISTK